MKLALVTDAWEPQVNGVVTTLVELVRELECRGWKVRVIHPGMFRTRPCPGYAGIDLAIAPGKEMSRQLDVFAPDAVHLATEGPLGWAGRPKQWRPFAAAVCCAALLGIATGAAASGGKQQIPEKSAAGKDRPGSIQFDAFNNAIDTPLLRKGSNGSAVVRAQILLDRAWYSSGEIDGRYGANMERMVRAYQVARGLQPTGTVTSQTWQTLRQDSAPLLVRYVLTQADIAGPYERTPRDMVERSKLKALVYETPLEALAERFHSSAAYLRRLNGGGEWTVGRELIVPGVGNTEPPAKAASIQIDKAARVLWVLDSKRLPVAGFPISIGNERNDPLPIGTMAIKNEVKLPSFTYDPKLLKNAPATATKVEIRPGPNNPVGTYWLGLTKPHWGIHGTPNPGNVGHSETNGCIHLTNWDVERLSLLAKAGFKVEVRP